MQHASKFQLIEAVGSRFVAQAQCVWNLGPMSPIQ